MTNKYFPLPLIGNFIGKAHWKLLKPFKYINLPVEVNIPAGFVSDGASIPKIFYSLIGSPWSGKYAKAAVIHDFGYATQAHTRKKTDQIFYDGMTILGVTWWRRKTMYCAVRTFSWVFWRKKENTSELKTSCCRKGI